MMRRTWAAVSTFVLAVALGVVPALAFQPPTGQAEFVPAKNLPQTEQMPAGPLLLAAYAFIWVAVAFYVWTLWRRLNKVEHEMRALAQKTSRR
jgi:CcmD family protein